MICVHSLNIALELFGADRLMFGSDYPVCLLAASYDRVLGIVSGDSHEISATPIARRYFPETRRGFTVCKLDV